MRRVEVEAGTAGSQDWGGGPTESRGYGFQEQCLSWGWGPGGRRERPPDKTEAGCRGVRDAQSVLTGIRRNVGFCPT